MYKKIKYAIVFAFALTIIGLPAITYDGVSYNSTPTAYAEVCNPQDELCTEEYQDPALKCAEKGGNPDECDLVAKYINPMIIFLSIFVGIAVTVGIVYGGIEYASAGSDPGKVQKARSHIRASIIALLTYLFLYALLKWLEPGGGA